MRYAFGPAGLALLCSLLVPVMAHGQGAQRPDPESPAGVEYALPLEQARENAGGGKPDKSSNRRGAGAAARGASSLFGAGIVARKASGGRDARDTNGTPGARAGGGRSPAPGGDGGPGDADRAGASPTVKRAGVAALDASNGSATLWVGGIAVAVLLVGGLLGLVLRRSLRSAGA